MAAASGYTILDQRLDHYKEIVSKKKEEKDMTKGFLLDFFKILDPKGQAHLAQDVSGCATDELLRLLVKSLTDCLLGPMKGAGGKTSSNPTPMVPRLGIEDSIDNMVAQDHDPVTRGAQKALRRNCMQRDGSRCVASRAWQNGLENIPDDDDTANLEAAHILPFNLGSFNRNDSQEVLKHANTWVNINRYFPTLKTMSFTSEHLNAEKNAMMLDRTLHFEFSAFRMCFVATGIRNQYHIKTFKDIPSQALKCLPTNRLATFQSHSGSWELPDPELLRIHAQLAEFFHMSGHGERIDKILRDYEELGVLASDGSTNVEDLLAIRLSSLPLNVRERSDSESKPSGKHPLSKEQGGPSENVRPRSDSESKASGKHVAPKRGGQQPSPSGPENKP
ncbi:hypothetical protein N7481_006371 [Penicillium waksmanii]|uniref:uncharacterized protein n=1 Tax=Penicillium waksmanii TaxID=69791 RepID=UPI0025487EAE|nr:uncharacterized protein N7481_006371 [Penicillium waksmanii]KAJ5984272.1 hypothetical protein N7481_006371 [Penicillium waksmanii]